MTDITIEQLQAELAAAQSEKEALSAKNAEILAEKRKATNRLEQFSDYDDLKAKAANADKFSGLDDDLIEKALKLKKMAETEEEREILEREGLDGLVKRRTQGVTDRLKAEREKAAKEAAAEKARADDLAAKMKERDFELAVSSAVAKSGKFQPGSERYILNDVSSFVRYDEDGEMYLEEGGVRLHSADDPNGHMTVEEFVMTRIPEMAPMLLKQPSGAGARGSGANAIDTKNPFMTGDGGAQAKLRNQDPDLAKKLFKQAQETGKANVKIGMNF